MSQTYKATGINLKSIPLGESDRILTILTREHGLIRVAAPGARKPKSKLGGRGELFVVNDLLLSKGRSLERLVQAERVVSFPALSRDLAKLTVAQYWAEMILHQTLDHDPTDTLFEWFCAQLSVLAEASGGTVILVHLTRGIFNLLHLSGILPQVNRCCLTGQPVDPQWLGHRKVIFSPKAGGIVLPTDQVPDNGRRSRDWSAQAALPRQFGPRPEGATALVLSAQELHLMQQLARSIALQSESPSELPSPDLPPLIDSVSVWLNIERALRAYVSYHIERPIRSAELLDSCFSQPPLAVSPVIS